MVTLLSIKITHSCNGGAGLRSDTHRCPVDEKSDLRLLAYVHLKLFRMAGNSPILYCTTYIMAYGVVVVRYGYRASTKEKYILENNHQSQPPAGEFISSSR